MPQVEAPKELSEYVQTLRTKVPEVRTVIYDPTERAILAVLEAEPWNPAPRRAVYEAERQALSHWPRKIPAVDFKLVNAREFVPEYSNAEGQDEDEWVVLFERSE